MIETSQSNLGRWHNETHYLQRKLGAGTAGTTSHPIRVGGAGFGSLCTGRWRARGIGRRRRRIRDDPAPGSHLRAGGRSGASAVGRTDAFPSQSAADLVGAAA